MYLVGLKSNLNLFLLILRVYICITFFFFSSRRRHTRFDCDWSSDVCSSDLSIPIRVGKLSNEVVKVMCDSSVEANIICQTYVDKYKFNKLPIRMTFYGFGHTWEYYEVIEEYVWIYKKKIKLALFVSPNGRIPSEILLGMPFFIAIGFHLNYTTSDWILSGKFSGEGIRVSNSIGDGNKAREDGEVIRAFFPIGSKLPKSLKN